MWPSRQITMMRWRLRRRRKKVANSHISLDVSIADRSQSQEKSTFIPGSFDPELNGNNDTHSHELKKDVHTFLAVRKGNCERIGHESRFCTFCLISLTELFNIV